MLEAAREAQLTGAMPDLSFLTQPTKIVIPPKLAVIFTVHSGALIGAVEEDDSRRPLTDEETRALLEDYERLKENERESCEKHTTI